MVCRAWDSSMDDAVFRRESAVEYFKELVEGALARQRITAGELTAFYVVHLLAQFLQRPAEEDEAPLGFQLARALESGGIQQRASLKQIGDLSLFISGFFSDSLRRKLVDVDYYVSIGGFAYNTLGLHQGHTVSPVFPELAGKIAHLVDVLSEGGRRTSLAPHPGLLRLYETSLKTG